MKATSKSFAALAEAKAWRAEAQVALRAGRMGPWYEQALRLRVHPEFGSVRLTEIGRGDLQRFVDRMLKDCTEPSTIRSTLLPVRVIFRRAVARGDIAVNPTVGLELPAARGRRERVASREEAAALLGALQRYRALWATAI